MEYELSYQLSRDIDWFFKFKDVYFHVASNGHKLPYIQQEDGLYIVDQETNRELQSITERHIRDRRRTTYKIITRDNPHGLNYTTFEDYAKIGFVSLDTVSDGLDSKRFHVIARPEEYRNLYLKYKLGEINIFDNRMYIYDIDGTQLNLE